MLVAARASGTQTTQAAHRPADHTSATQTTRHQAPSHTAMKVNDINSVPRAVSTRMVSSSMALMTPFPLPASTSRRRVQRARACIRQPERRVRGTE